MIRNTASAYGWPHKILHWTMAIGIFGLFGMGLYMSELELSPDKLKLYGLHKSFGITILALVTLRLVWRMTNPVPQLPAATPKIEALAAHAVHCALYVLMAMIPISGWLMSSYAGFPVSVFGVYTLPNLVSPDKEMLGLIKQAHELLAYAIVGLAALHGFAAVHHHFIKKDGVLRRMWF